MVILLLIDTSGDNGQIILSGDGEVLSVTTLNNPRTQAADVNSCIEEILSINRLTYHDLSGIAVCGGPGSYTGLRVAMATAKGLCYALDIPLQVHNKLSLMALPFLYSDKKQYSSSISIIKAREGEYFISSHNDSFQYSRYPELIIEDQLENIILDTKNKTLIFKELNLNNLKFLEGGQFLVQDFKAIDTQYWSKYAFEKYSDRDFTVLDIAEPIYLKQVYINK